jgi:ankyrin repeat protein
MPRYFLFSLVLFVILISFACKPQSEAVTPDGAKQILQLRGYEINAKGYFKAILAEDLAAIRTFFQAGFDINTQNEKGETPLTFAMSCCETKTIKVLLEKVDVNQRDKDGTTALFLAMKKNKSDIIDLILEKNPDVNVPGKDDLTLLHVAATKNDLELIQTLIDRGANVNAISKSNGSIPMIESCIGSPPQTEAIKLFLSKGADINQAGNNKATCLMYVASAGHAELVSELLKAGADPKLKDKDGMTALAWAAKYKRDNVVALLKGK